MGIREYFKENLSKDDLKMQEFRIEKTRDKRELKFDVEAELTEEDWRGMKAELEDQMESLVYGGAGIELASNMKIIFPERFEDLEFNEEVLEKFNKKVEEYLLDKKEMRETKERDGKGEYYLELLLLEMLVGLKILFGKRNELKLNERWNKLKLALDRLRSEEDWYSHMDYASKIAILYPDRVFDLKLDENVFDEIRTGMDLLRERNNWRAFIGIAKIFRILFPKRFKKVGLSDTDWKKIREEMRRDPFESFGSAMARERLLRMARIAAALKILAADEIVITNDKFELIMDEEENNGFKQEARKRPERRSF